MSESGDARGLIECGDCGRSDGGCDRIVEVDTRPATAERVTELENRSQS